MFPLKALPLLVGGLIGGALGGGRKKAPAAEPPVLQRRPATRDEAWQEAERERELARRRGPGADRIVSGMSVPAGGLGRLIVGS